MTAAPAPAAPARETRTWLHALRVRDFRNLAAVDLSLGRDGAALIGDNGHGKTNLLEALYYLQLFRSFRGARDVELVRFGAESFHVSAGLHGSRAQQVGVGFECGPARRGAGRKRIRLDGAEPPTIADAVGAVTAVLFAPHDARLVGGAPTERRRFLDVMLSLAARPYLRALQQYRGALVRRNHALREAQRGGNLDAVAAWEPALAAAGAVLWSHRADWAARSAPEFARLCTAIGERGEAALRHQACPADQDTTEAALLEALDRRRALHVRRGATLDGPHRDDLALHLDGVDLRTYGSAGQQRTAAIALRLLEADTLRDAHRTEPLVLLDDPFAELDASRAGRILDLLAEGAPGQTFLAVPREEDVPDRFTALARIRVRNGTLTPEAQ